MKNLIFLAALFLSYTSPAQENFNKNTFSGIKKLSTINLSNIEDPYLVHLEYVKSPDAIGNAYKQHLSQIKENIASKYPRKEQKAIQQNRGLVNPPEVVNGFNLSGVQVGIPLDNHLSMSKDWVVSVGNFYVSIYSKEGNLVKNVGLQSLASEAGVSAQAFDPRIMYDRTNDRYVLTFLAGFDSQDTHIIVGFSATDDPTGDWHLYDITGNPNQTNEWTDYPMLSMTASDVFITINLLLDNSTWQAGFVETIIWQMDKLTAYNGEDLNLIRWDSIEIEGQNIRNLCPVESGDGQDLQEMHFVSNRNFAEENDTFFLVKVVGSVMDDDIDYIEMDYIISDTPYGVPPNAKQFFGFLQTNDARVLEAFILNNEIQFVGNTRNLDNNKAGIYHGIINDLNNPNVELHHIIGEEVEIGYPGIIYAGDSEDDHDAIIAFNHSAKTVFPGMSALYSVPEQGYSDIIRVREGNSHVDLLASKIERWGDYYGTQRDFDTNEFWISGFLGHTGDTNRPYTARLKKPEITVGTEDLKAVEIATSVYPNPTNRSRVSVDINIPENADQIKLVLTDNQGQIVDKLYDEAVYKVGKVNFSFYTSDLVTGIYFVNIFLNNQHIKAEKIIVD